MSIYSMYFSPTGGTKKVMDILAEEIGADSCIDLCDKDTDYEANRFGPEDVCLVGVPSYGGRVPDIALSRIHKMKASGTPAAAIVVFGNRAYDDTLLELKNELRSVGFLVISAAAAVAEHSIMRQYGSGRPDGQDEKELRDYAVRLGALLSEKEDPKEAEVPGSEPYREYGGVPFKPKAGKTCTGCGLCASQCPAGAIPVDSPAVTDEALCISCMRCVAICPIQARELNPAVLFAASLKMKKALSGRKENEFF